MKQWAADVGNDPNDDFNIIIDILYGEKFKEDHFATIKQNPEGGLSITWYPHKEELVIPLDWLLSILQGAKKELEGLRFIKHDEK